MEASMNNYDEIKKDDNDDNDVFVEDATSTDSISPQRKNRSNSVIDSIGTSGESSPRANVSPRSKSAPTMDTSFDESRCYSITSDSAEALPPDSVRKIPDTIDAHVRIIAEDDDDDVIVKRPLTPVARLPVPKDAQCYNMNHKNRGKCVIFNNEEFDMEGFEKREGSTTDAKRLSATFGRLGFDIEVYDNLTHSEILDTVEKLSKLDHTDNDCICIIVLTHGLQNDLICAKDVAYKSDKIWKPFTGDKCATLAGKPKLFFFQACRGDEFDSGVVLSPLSAMPSSTDSVTSYKIPTHSDFLIAHSSAQNFYTWRNPTEGTWYVQCLCDILDEYGTKLDLLSMLMLTARKVATEYASYDPQDATKHDKKQVPSTTTMLLRYVYFPSKPSA